MFPIKLALWLSVLVPIVLWLFADTLVPHPFTFFSFRAVSVQYTGIIGIAMMSLGLLLASRPLWLEKSLNGLDKMYRLHKWLGIGGLILSILHWWLGKGTKWMVGWGWLDKPERHPRPTVELSSWEQWIGSQRGRAETLGEWGFLPCRCPVASGFGASRALPSI